MVLTAEEEELHADLVAEEATAMAIWLGKVMINGNFRILKWQYFVGMFPEI